MDDLMISLSFTLSIVIFYCMALYFTFEGCRYHPRFRWLFGGMMTLGTAGTLLVLINAWGL